jgi:dimeric dUTPase (all-alpha-NTP-PPase superfamily)
MDIIKMIDTIETKGIDAESFVPELHDKLVKLYNEKDIEWYTEILKDMLSLAVHLKFDLVLKYFGVRPIVTSDERKQFQEIFKYVATRNNNKDWFLDLFALYLGLIVVFQFDARIIERNFFGEKKF